MTVKDRFLDALEGWWFWCLVGVLPVAVGIAIAMLNADPDEPPGFRDAECFSVARSDGVSNVQRASTARCDDPRSTHRVVSEAAEGTTPGPSCPLVVEMSNRGSEVRTVCVAPK